MARNSKKVAHKKPLPEKWSGSYHTVLALIPVYLLIESFMRSGANNSRDTLPDTLRHLIQKALDKSSNLNLEKFNIEYVGLLILITLVVSLFVLTNFFFSYILKRYFIKWQACFLLQMGASVIRLLLVFVLIVNLVNLFF